MDDEDLRTTLTVATFPLAHVDNTRYQLTCAIVNAFRNGVSVREGGPLPPVPERLQPDPLLTQLLWLHHGLLTETDANRATEYVHDRQLVWVDTFRRATALTAADAAYAPLLLSLPAATASPPFLLHRQLDMSLLSAALVDSTSVLIILGERYDQQSVAQCWSALSQLIVTGTSLPCPFASLRRAVDDILRARRGKALQLGLYTRAPVAQNTCEWAALARSRYVVWTYREAVEQARRRQAQDVHAGIVPVPRAAVPRDIPAGKHTTARATLLAADAGLPMPPPVVSVEPAAAPAPAPEADARLARLTAEEREALAAAARTVASHGDSESAAPHQPSSRLKPTPPPEPSALAEKTLSAHAPGLEKADILSLLHMYDRLHNIDKTEGYKEKWLHELQAVHWVARGAPTSNKRRLIALLLDIVAPTPSGSWTETLQDAGIYEQLQLYEVKYSLDDKKWAIAIPKRAPRTHVLFARTTMTDGKKRYQLIVPSFGELKVEVLLEALRTHQRWPASSASAPRPPRTHGRVRAPQ